MAGQDGRQAEKDLKVEKLYGLASFRSSLCAETLFFLDPDLELSLPCSIETASKYQKEAIVRIRSCSALRLHISNVCRSRSYHDYTCLMSKPS